MTDEQALGLKEGDRVYISWGRTRYYRRVVCVYPSVEGSDGVRVRCRDEGLTRNGRRMPSRLYLPEHLDKAVRKTVPRDHLAGNVFADWLDENGEPAAAAKLRAAFPVGGKARVLYT